MKPKKKVRILSIDGGGIRGILPGITLMQIEKKIQEKTQNPNKRLADYFDFMAGTSTGGILSLSYLMPNADGRPLLTAEEAVKLYLEKGDAIFDTTLRQRIRSGNCVLDEKYDAAAIEKALAETFGDTMLADLIKPCIISSYDIKNGKPHFFKQHKAHNAIYNFKVKEVARATSAAPTYFETALVKSELGSEFPLIDGGVFVNNPTLVAYSAVRTMKFPGICEFPTAKDMLIVSIGTGSKSKQYNYQKAKDWGAVGWIKPIIEIMMSASSQTVHYHLRQIFDTLSAANKADYYRLEPEVLTADAEMDNASKENLLKLKEDGLSYVSKSEVDQQLDSIVDKLINYGEEALA